MNEHNTEEPSIKDEADDPDQLKHDEPEKVDNDESQDSRVVPND